MESAGLALTEDRDTDIVSIGYYDTSLEKFLLVVKNREDSRHKWHFIYEVNGKNWNEGHGVAINEDKKIFIVGANEDNGTATSLFLLRVSSDGKRCGKDRDIDFWELIVARSNLDETLVMTSFFVDFIDKIDLSTDTSSIEVAYEICENENTDHVSTISPTWLLTIGAFVTLTRHY